jgi:hypothetical protein
MKIKLAGMTHVLAAVVKNIKNAAGNEKYGFIIIL